MFSNCRGKDDQSSFAKTADRRTMHMVIAAMNVSVAFVGVRPTPTETTSGDSSNFTRKIRFQTLDQGKARENEGKAWLLNDNYGVKEE